MARKAAVKTTPGAAAKPKRAARKTTPSPETLTELGLGRLIDLVLAETGRNPAFKKLVTAAVAGLQGPEAVAALVDRRLTALERARGFIDWQKRRVFAADLDAMVSTIIAELAPRDAESALDRLLRFLIGSPTVLERVDDSNGQLHGIYERAADAAATIARSLREEASTRLALRLVPLVDTDGFGFLEDLLLQLIDALPETFLADLDMALAAAMPPAPRNPGKSEAAWASTLARTRYGRMREAIADRRGDIDGFIRLEQDIAGECPDRIAIAERLLGGDRAAEALDWVRRPQPRGAAMVTRQELLTGQFDPTAPERERVALEIRILDALGQADAAQSLRWDAFEQTLDREMLRTYLAKLPDFEDDEALRRALDLAAGHPNPYRALHFFTHWPAPQRLARLVQSRWAEWDGGRYEILVPAAEALEQAHPVEASRLYRLLLEDILGNGRSSAYGHGARHLASLDVLAGQVPEGALDPGPEAYRDRLRKDHGRKQAFWAQVGS